MNTSVDVELVVFDKDGTLSNSEGHLIFIAERRVDMVGGGFDGGHFGG